jgi:hypothetical protein
VGLNSILAQAKRKEDAASFRKHMVMTGLTICNQCLTSALSFAEVNHALNVIMRKCDSAMVQVDADKMTVGPDYKLRSENDNLFYFGCSIQCFLTMRH